MTHLWALALVATQGAAACPDPGAMATGISILTATHRATYSLNRGSDVQARIAMSDGWSTIAQTLSHGLIAVETRADFADPAIPDQQTELALPDDARLLPVPGETLAVPARVIDPSTGQSDEVVLTLTAGEAGRIRIGDCLLEGLPITVLHDRPGATYRSHIVYLPAYGFAYLARRQIASFPEEVFPPTGIIAE